MPVHHVKLADCDRPIRGVELSHWEDCVMLWVWVGTGRSPTPRSFLHEVLVDDLNDLADVDGGEDYLDVV